LVAELDPVVVEPATGNHGEAVKMCYVVCCEEGCEDVADKTTDGVHSEDIQRIINAKNELELSGIVGTCGSDDTIDYCRPGGDESGTGGNGDETGDDARAESDGGPFALKTIIKETPGDASDAGSQVGYDSGHDSAHVGSEGRTGVESKPTNPKEDGADDNVCDVVGTIIELVSLYHLSALFYKEG
jgi:hypothetical protein